jgi:hypothetical protein
LLEQEKQNMELSIRYFVKLKIAYQFREEVVNEMSEKLSEMEQQYQSLADEEHQIIGNF